MNFTEHFLDCVETSEYLKIINNPSEVGEKHHILPRSIWPEFSKQPWNIVKLGYADHYRVHCLLPNMVSGKARASMLYAWNLMSGRFGGDVEAGGKYAEFRQELNKIISERNSEIVWSQERLDKASESMIGDKNHQFGKTKELSVWYGKVGPNKDRVWSEETIKKFSERSIGERNGMFGKNHSEETKRKIAETRTGEKSWQFGKTTSDHQKEAARQTSLNRKWTPEERRKVGVARMLPVLYQNQVFESQTQLSGYLGISKSKAGNMVGREVSRLPKNWKDLAEFKHLTEYQNSDTSQLSNIKEA